MTTFVHRILGTNGGETWVNVVHSTAAPGDITTAQTVWDGAVSAWWLGVPAGTNNLDAIVPTGVQIIETSTTALDPVTGKQTAKATTAHVSAGVDAGEPLPPQLSIVCSFRTSTPTRAGRGRNYAPVFAVDVLAAGELAPAAQTRVKNAYKNLLDALQTGGYTPVIYHRSTKTTTPITGGDVGTVFDNQRRRRNKLTEARSSFVL